MEFSGIGDKKARGALFGYRHKPKIKEVAAVLGSLTQAGWFEAYPKVCRHGTCT